MRAILEISAYPPIYTGAISSRESRMSKADQSLPRSLDLRTQRGPLMCLLVAVGIFMTLGGAVNAASVQDEARQFFERFVAAQNAHDLATVGSMLWNSEDFL